MERKLHLEIYVTAFIVTVLIFGLGVYVGSLMTQQAIGIAEKQLREARQELTEMELMFFIDNSYAYCPYYLEQFESVGKVRETLGKEIESLERRGEDPGKLKEEYFVFEVFNFAIGEKIVLMCQYDLKQALYFYPKDCKTCSDVAAALERLRNSKSYYVYSFNGDSQSSLVNSMKKQYNIVSMPAIVCNGKIIQGAKLNAESIAENC